MDCFCLDSCGKGRTDRRMRGECHHSLPNKRDPSGWPGCDTTGAVRLLRYDLTNFQGQFFFHKRLVKKMYAAVQNTVPGNHIGIIAG